MTSQPAPPYNCPSIGGMVCISLMTVFAIISIVFTSKSWQGGIDDYQNDAYVASGMGAVALVFGIAAYPLTYKGATGLTEQHNSTSTKGIMIASWVFYGIMIIASIAAVGLGVSGGDVAPAFVVYIILWGIAGWSFMFAYAEVARRSFEQGDNAGNAAQGSQNEQSGVSKAHVGVGDTTTNTTTVTTTKTVTVNEDGTCSNKVVKRTTNPDGSVLVEELIEDIDV